MADMMSALRDLAWLRNNAALRSDVPILAWATVVTGSPYVTVLMENDETNTPRQVSNAAGAVWPGQRVRVEVQGRRITILAPGNNASLGWVWSGGKYARLWGYEPGGVELVTDTGGRVALGTNGSAVLRSGAGAEVGFTAGGSVTMYAGPGGTATVHGAAGSSSGRLNIFSSGQVTLYSAGGGGFINLQTDGVIDVAARAGVRVRSGTNANDAVEISGQHYEGVRLGQNGAGNQKVMAGLSGSSGRLAVMAMPFSSSAANMRYDTSTGIVHYTSSLEEHKADIQPADVDEDTYLALQPRTWIDKRSAEMLAEALSHEAAGEEVEPWLYDGGPLRRVTGLVAEEVVESGNEWLADRDADGNLTGLTYDRGWVPLVAIVRRLRGKIAEQDERIATLESQVEKLITLLEERDG